MSIAILDKFTIGQIKEFQKKATGISDLQKRKRITELFAIQHGLSMKEVYGLLRISFPSFMVEK